MASPSVAEVDHPLPAVAAMQEDEEDKAGDVDDSCGDDTCQHQRKLDKTVPHVLLVYNKRVFAVPVSRFEDTDLLATWEQYQTRLKNANPFVVSDLFAFLNAGVDGADVELTSDPIDLSTKQIAAYLELVKMTKTSYIVTPPDFVGLTVVHALTIV